MAILCHSMVEMPMSFVEAYIGVSTWDVPGGKKEGRRLVVLMTKRAKARGYI